MTQYQFIIDNFNDNSIDTSIWSPASGSVNQTETSGKLNTPCAASAAPTSMRTQRNWYDLRKGRLAIRLTRSGTTDSNVYTYFGIRDVSNNNYFLFARSNDATLQNAANDLGTGTATNVDTTIGLGPSWTANSFIGWTYTEGTKTYSLGKSTDGVTWTEIHKYVVTTSGAFDFKRAGLMVGCTSYGTVTNFTPQWDDYSYFIQNTALTVKTRSGGAWVASSVKVRSGGAWKRAVQKVRTSGGWKQSV
jgi:hypothetical protein